MEKVVLTIPIIPLSKIVFFPKSKINIHVIEPEHKNMINDSLSKQKLIGIALRKPSVETEEEARPEIFKFFTIGKILNEEIREEEENYTVLIEGIERARVIAEIEDAPYLNARVVPMSDYLDPGKKIEMALLTTELIKLTEDFASVYTQHQALIRRIVTSHRHPGIIADQIAFSFVSDEYDKQCILSETNIFRRTQLINIQLRMLIQKFSFEKFRDII